MLVKKSLLILSLLFASNIFCNKNLLDAVRNGDINRVQNILNADTSVNINFKGAYGNTALMLACNRNDVTITQLLIANGANLNEQDEYCNTALMSACFKKHRTIAQLLIENNANPNLKNKYGDTALMMACENNSLTIAQLLIENNANLDLQDTYGNTALIIACKNNSLTIAQLLLASGANPNLRDKNGYTALMWTCHKYFEVRHNDFFNIAQLLIQNGTDPNLRTNDGATVLQTVCNKHDVNLAALLVLAGANETTVIDRSQNFTLEYPIVKFARNLRQWILANEANRQRIPNHENIEKAFDTVQAVDEEKIIAGLMLNNELNIQLAMELVLQFRLADETFAINHFNEIYKEYNRLTPLNSKRNALPCT